MQGFANATDDVKAIYKHVRRQIEIFAQDSGFVFNQVHHILADVRRRRSLPFTGPSLPATEKRSNGSVSL